MTVELSERTSLLVLGVGNILWADEGFGVRCVEAFNATFRPLPGTAILDGGTLGMYLLEPIENTDDLLVFDCADLGEKPGSMRLLDENDIELWTSTKLSAHQGGMNDILAMAALQGKSPKRLAVVAVQPGELQDYGGSLTAACAKMVSPAVELAAQKLASWGYAFERRSPSEKVESLSFESLSREVYETERPSQDAACRLGDLRFFPKA